MSGVADPGGEEVAAALRAAIGGIKQRGAWQEAGLELA
ncbi:MAG: hypothetical protein ACLPZR_14890 [Solirubrobacteraceae bacterium]